MILSRSKIITRLLAGFLLIVLATVILGGVATRGISQLSEMTRDIFDHPFTVLTTTFEIKTLIQGNEIRLQRLLRIKDPVEFERTLQAVTESVLKADKLLEIVRERYLGPKEDIEQLKKALAEWRAARKDCVALIKSGHRSEAVLLADGRVAGLARQTEKEVDDLINFASNKAAGFKSAAGQLSETSTRIIVFGFLALTLFSIVIAVIITRSVAVSLKLALNMIKVLAEGSQEKVRIAEAIANGDLSHDLKISEPIVIDPASLPDDEMGLLVREMVALSRTQFGLDEAFIKMTAALRESRESERLRNWLKSGLGELNDLMRGEQETSGMADRVLGFLAEYVGAGAAVFYLYNEQEDVLTRAASYAFTRRAGSILGDRIQPGQGLIGQAAREKRTITRTNVPPDYLAIGSALGDALPLVISVLPLLKENRLVGVLELASFKEFSSGEAQFLELALPGIAIGFSINLARQEKNSLLEKTIEQAEELRIQQEELQQSNEELEERAQMLEQQRELIRDKNRDVESASEELRRKAEELGRISNYKSEFLANMSHELRTPLNSLMILSGLLKENKEGNLNPKQVEFAGMISSAGHDLLDLINDILDISKIEAGRMEYRCEDVEVLKFSAVMESMFRPTAEQKGLVYRCEVDAGVVEVIRTDEQRTLQILKNLLSNAFKFTSQGEVVLKIGIPAAGENPLSGPALAFCVSDTGIGIPAKALEHIFKSFRQADGSTSRKYGGTGLGLSISRELAHGLHGDIRVKSREGEGSLFTLFLPLEQPPELLEQCDGRLNSTPVAVPSESLPPVARERSGSASLAVAVLPDDRERIKEGEKSLLIIEDDLVFASTLMEAVRTRGFAALVATDGDSGVALADRFQPSAIILDVLLPGINGWWVMQSLKENHRTRHIPVHFLTCTEDRQKAMSMGAIGFLTKPVDNQQLDTVFQTIEDSLARKVKQLLIVEDNRDEAISMVSLLQERNVEITVAETGREAIKQLSARPFDSIVLDLGLSDMSGFDLLEHVRKMDEARRVPIIIHSGRELTHEEERKLRHYAESIIIKGAKSPERLLNEVSLFLHLVESRLHPDKQRMIRSTLDRETILVGKKVLLVDDDMRNVFSLLSLLTEKEMTVIEADNGKEALARLSEYPAVDIVLMDIMMPEMDGYTAIREIRKDPRFEKLPIIAMTARALKGDQEKCLAVGASDYISKPIDVERLLSLLRVWLYQGVS